MSERTCPICEKTIQSKNFKRHLKTHPAESLRNEIALTPRRVAVLDLPADLTTAEVEKLKRFLDVWVDA